MEDLNPVEYGKLLAKVEGLEAKVSSMDADIKPPSFSEPE